MGLLSVSAALSQLNAGSRILADTEPTELLSCLGRVLAEDVIAAIDVPPADNSAMDGYAIRFDDWMADDRVQTVSQRIVAGSPPEPLEPGTAARIFTGAEIPEGADTVVMQENCEQNEAGVVIRLLPDKGANIRPGAQDIHAGQTILSAGIRLRAQDIGLIASLGVANVNTRVPLKVAILSTGDELVEPGKVVQKGQIYNSNRYTLEGLVRAWGFEPVGLGIVPDNPDMIRELLIEASEKADVIVSSGGVSVGEEDHVKAVVESLGGIDLWRIAMKPGKPFAFGHVRSTPFLGLPGNPAAVLVTCLIIARPFLFACQGNSTIQPQSLRMSALFERKGGTREEYLRARTVPEGVECYPNQSSGVLFSSSWGDGLVVQSVGQDINRGDLVNFLPYALLN